MNHQRCAEHEKLYDRYFQVKQTPVRGMTITAKEDELAKAKLNFGYFAMLSNDIRNPIQALETYRRLIQQYPDDAYAGMARSDMVACYQSLCGHEFNVGVFYYKKKQYKAAKIRFAAVIEKYPDVGYHHRALTYLANCDAWIQSRLQPPEVPVAQ